MPTHIEQELGIAPTTNRIRRWFRKHMPSKGVSLDPLTVNYETWRAMSKNIRKWPSYQEAPNYVEVLVSPEDWDDYWCVDTSRKEAGVSAYVKARIADKGVWVSGEPQVFVFEDDTIERGDFEIICQFAEPLTAEELAQQRESMRRVPTFNNPRTMSYPVAATNLLPANASAEWDQNVYMAADADAVPSQSVQTPTYDNAAPVVAAVPSMPAPMHSEDPVREVEVRAVDVIQVAEDAVDVQSVDEQDTDAAYAVGPDPFGEADEEVANHADADESEAEDVYAKAEVDETEDTANPVEVEELVQDDAPEPLEDEGSLPDVAAESEDLVEADEVSGGLADSPEQELNLAQELVDIFWEQDGDEEQPPQDASEEQPSQDEDANDAGEADDEQPLQDASEEHLLQDEDAEADQETDLGEAAEDDAPPEEEPASQDAMVDDEQEQADVIDIELSAIDVSTPEPESAAREDQPQDEPEQSSDVDAEPEPDAEPDPESAPYSAFDQSLEYDSDLDDDLDAEPLEVLTPSPEPVPSARYVDPENPGYLYLIGKSEFRLEVHPGDCIGAVRWGEDVPEQVNVRLDADGFPYAEVMQCTIDVQNGRWCVTNHATHGTRLTKATGERYVLGKSVPCPLDPDDTLWLGHERPLRVEY